MTKKPPEESADATPRRKRVLEVSKRWTCSSDLESSRRSCRDLQARNRRAKPSRQPCDFLPGKFPDAKRYMPCVKLIVASYRKEHEQRDLTLEDA
jgi:hypothetical protein